MLEPLSSYILLILLLTNLPQPPPLHSTLCTLPYPTLPLYPSHSLLYPTLPLSYPFSSLHPLPKPILSILLSTLYPLHESTPPHILRPLKILIHVMKYDQYNLYYLCFIIYFIYVHVNPDRSVLFTCINKLVMYAPLIYTDVYRALSFG